MNRKIEHLTEGQIRAYHDRSLEDPDLMRAERHLADCPGCRTVSESILERSQQFQSHFSHLDPNPGSDHPKSLSSARSLLVNRMELEKEKQTMKPNAVQRIPPLAWVTLGLVIVLSVALTFQPVRALAEDFLALFRVEEIRVVQVNSDEVPDKLESSSNLEYILSNQVELEEQGEPQEAADIAEAAALAGFTPRLPAEIEGEPKFRVNPAGNLSLVVDLELVRAVLKDIDREDIILPDELDGAVVQVRIPASLSASFGDCEIRAYPAPIDPDEPEAVEWDFRSCTKLMQVPSPAVSAPPDLDLTQIGVAYLQLFGMSAEEAASFARSVNWTTTFVVPLPRYGADYEEVQVDGVNGTLIYDYGMTNEYYTLIWIKDGFIYALSGWGGRSAALKIAGSIQ